MYIDPGQQALQDFLRRRCGVSFRGIRLLGLRISLNGRTSLEKGFPVVTLDTLDVTLMGTEK